MWIKGPGTTDLWKNRGWQSHATVPLTFNCGQKTSSPCPGSGGEGRVPGTASHTPAQSGWPALGGKSIKTMPIIWRKRLTVNVKMFLPRTFNEMWFLYYQHCGFSFFSAQPCIEWSHLYLAKDVQNGPSKNVKLWFQNVRYLIFIQ